MTAIGYNPYEGVDWDEDDQLKAEFHTHTSNAGYDSEEPPEAHEVIDDYEEYGYDVLCVSDKGGVDLVWPWTDLSSIVDGWEDRYPIGTHDDAPDEESQVDLVAIPGAEVDVTHHVLSSHCEVNNNDVDGDELDDVFAAIEEADGDAWVAHPARVSETFDEWDFWVEHFEDTVLGIEAFHKQEFGRIDERLLDRLLVEFLPERYIWGIANGDPSGDDNGGWDRDFNVRWSTVLLPPDDQDAESVREAMRNGQFYFTTRNVRDFDDMEDDWDAGNDPPTIDAIGVDDSEETITVSSSDADRIEWIVGGTKINEGDTFEYGEHSRLYVRIVLHNDYGRTGTQPITFKNVNTLEVN